MKNNEKHREPEPDTKPEDTQTPSSKPSPKRGAYPTPRAEIERAKPYIPAPDQPDRQESTNSDSPAGDDAEV